MHFTGSEIFFTSGGTESDNWAIKGCAFADESKRATITSTIEHHAVLRSCQFIEKLGYPVAYINPNSNGLITVEMLERVIAGILVSTGSACDSNTANWNTKIIAQSI